MAAHQAPPSLGFSRHEHWSGLPLPSPMNESENESEVGQSCPTLRDPMDCSLPGSSVHGLFQARVLEWVVIAFSIWSEWLLSESLQTINAGESVEKREPSSTVGENVNWFSFYGKQYGHFFKKLGIKLPHDPAIPLLGICPEKTISEIDTCTPVFTEALFTIARTWKQPRRSLTDE